MTTIGIPPRTQDDWDRPAAEVAADAQAAALLAAYQHQPEPFEAEFAAMACEHPKACSCENDYPGWAEHIAALAEANKRPQEAS
ncbi:hypothetical protein ABZ916_39495 [Streptomyces sp. NPDC046853]|uniref:hypothetical protein n=1 Tax=Streptomyces sp. NPDC046853 TaxID=3154920 RepID=UPI0033E7197D